MKKLLSIPPASTGEGHGKIDTIGTIDPLYCSLAVGNEHFDPFYLEIESRTA
jgi:hypothetical protein